MKKKLKVVKEVVETLFEKEKKLVNEVMLPNFKRFVLITQGDDGAVNTYIAPGVDLLNFIALLEFSKLNNSHTMFSKKPDEQKS